MIPEENIPYDLGMLNPLISCFLQDKPQITTAELLICYILDV